MARVFRPINVVCFGGGTGLPALLSGLRQNPWLNITAVVNMFDNGGSSGELRDQFGVLPPGDILKCMVALAEDSQMAREFLLRRIKHQPKPARPIDHTCGNLWLLGSELALGSPKLAIEALADSLAVKGTVLPVTFGKSSLCATVGKERKIVKGEVAVDRAMKSGQEIQGLFLEPKVCATTDVLEAIASADWLCFGPGSFYTSVFATLLPDHVAEAIRMGSGKIIYVCNLMTEGRGMHFGGGEYVRILEEHLAGFPITKVVLNSIMPGRMVNAYGANHQRPIIPESDNFCRDDPRAVVADLLDGSDKIARHDPGKLAHVLFALMNS